MKEFSENKQPAAVFQMEQVRNNMHFSLDDLGKIDRDRDEKIDASEIEYHLTMGITSTTVRTLDGALERLTIDTPKIAGAKEIRATFLDKERNRLMESHLVFPTGNSSHCLEADRKYSEGEEIDREEWNCYRKSGHLAVWRATDYKAEHPDKPLPRVDAKKGFSLFPPVKETKSFGDKLEHVINSAESVEIQIPPPPKKKL